MPRNDVLIIGGDFNAKVGLPLDGEKQSIGRFVTRTRNTIGELIANFAVLNDLDISNNTFQKKKHSLFTWSSNDKKTRNQIDYVLISRRRRTSITNTFSTRCFLTDTDHKPVISDIKLKVEAYTKKAEVVRYNLESLRKPDVAEKFRDMLYEKFEAAEETRDVVDVEAQWSQLKTVLHEAAEKNLGKTEHSWNPWISNDTIELIKQRARVRNWPRKAELRKKIKKAVRRDKTAYYNLAQEMANADENGNPKRSTQLSNS